VALNRGSFKKEEGSSYDPKLGYLAFGGIAPVKTTNTAVTVPVQRLTDSSDSSRHYFNYALDIDSYVFDGSPVLMGSEKLAILDTGTSFNYLPPAVAKAYNSKFVPPANESGGWFFVDCNATVPAFAVEIGGMQFTIDAPDNIYPAGTDANGNEFCISGTQNGGDPSDPSTIYTMCVSPLHENEFIFDIHK
jgi:hypothetical protein